MPGKILNRLTIARSLFKQLSRLTFQLLSSFKACPRLRRKVLRRPLPGAVGGAVAIVAKKRPRQCCGEVGRALSFLSVTRVIAWRERRGDRWTTAAQTREKQIERFPWTRT